MLNNHMENNTQDVDLNNDSAVSEGEIISTDNDTQTESHDVDWKAEYFKLKRQTKKQEVKNVQEQKVETKLETPTVSPEKLERLELKVEGYSDKEIELIYELGGTSKLENPLVKQAIENLRKEERSKSADVPIDGKAPVYKKYGQADLEGMSWQDLEKILPHADN